MNSKKGLLISLLVIVGLLFAALPVGQVQAQTGTTIYVGILAPSWTAAGGGGVFSAYIGPPSYGYVSPGTTAVFDGREAGIIKAGLTADPTSGNYEDEGLFGFIPTFTIDTLVAGTLTYDVETAAGVNPVWMTIEIDTGVVGVRGDNTTYQHVPTTNPAGWHTVDAGAGNWQKWNDGAGDTTGNPLISLSAVAAAHTGLDVVRVYLRLGMGNSYYNGGTGTIAWVDKVLVGGDTYDFVVIPTTVCTTICYVDSTNGSDTFPGTEAFPFLTIQKGIDTVVPGGTVNVAAGTYAENYSSELALKIDKRITLIGTGLPTVDGTSKGKVVQVTADYVTINGMRFVNAANGIGIYLYGVGDGFTSDNVTIASCEISNNNIGLFLAGANGATIKDNVFTGNSYRSIVIQQDSDANVVKGNSITMSGSSTLDGILIGSDSGNNTIGTSDKPNAITIPVSTTLESGATHLPRAIYLSGVGASVNTIQYNTIDGSASAIQIDGNTGTTTVDHNTIGQTTPPSFRGVQINGGSLVLTNNTLKNCVRPVEFWGANNVTITGNTLDGTSFDFINIGSFTGTLQPIQHNAFINMGSQKFMNRTTTSVDATENWWGSVCGPAAGTIVGDVTYSPWYADEAMTVLVSLGAGGEYVFSSDATTAVMNAVIACAAPGTVLTFQGGMYPGGIVVENNGLTFNLNGVTIGAGSPAFTISADDIVINGPGKLAGDGGSAGVLVNAGADNFILDGVEITGWTDGVNVAGAVESLKIVNNWIYTNTQSALEVVGTPTGVVTINGNLFKVNTGVDVVYGGTGSLDVTYNSWGLPGGPTDLAANVLFDPFNYYEIFFDMDAGTPAEEILRRVAVTQTFDVALKADAVNINSLSFKFTYDHTKLVLNSTTFVAPWLGNCAVVGTPATGTVVYRCLVNGDDISMVGAEIATFNFTANGSDPASLFDIQTEALFPTAGAGGGVKVWVNNAGYNAPSVPARLLTDENDGELIIDAIAQFTGFVDLQGRPNDSGALLQVFDSASGGVLKATAVSSSSGKYTTVYEPGMWMVVSTVSPAYTVNYYLRFDRDLYLPTSLVAGNRLAAKLTSPLTSLGNLVLLGGDASNNDVIDTLDAGCIGGAYGQAPAACGGAGSSTDVNGDGVMDIYDLSLMGGNYSKTVSLWSPQ